MPTKVTHALLMEEQLSDEPAYAPVKGTQYEVAEGVVVTLKLPTEALKRMFFEALEEVTAKEGGGLSDDVALAQIVTDGDWPDDEGDLLPGVVGVIPQDFISAASATIRPGTRLSKALSRLTAATSVPNGGLPAA